MLPHILNMLTCLLNWMQTYSSVLTFLITVVYVIATVLILRANKRSADAAKEQLTEMRRQYEESNRACIEVELIYERRCFYGLRFSNRGRHTAQNVQIQFDNSFIDSLQEETYANILRKQNGKLYVIGVDQHYDIYFGSNQYLRNANKVPAQGKVFYKSNGKSYTSDFYIDLENYGTIYSVNSKEEDILTEMKRQTTALNDISREVFKLSETQIHPQESESNDE